MVIGAEMLQPDGDLALSVEAAKQWANERGIPFLEGADIIQALNNGYLSVVSSILCYSRIWRGYHEGHGSWSF